MIFKVIRLEQPDSNNFQKLDFDSNQSDFVLDEDADFDGADDNATSDAIATKSLLNGVHFFFFFCLLACKVL